MNLLKLKFVHSDGKNWDIAYNNYLWEYFNEHGSTPNGEPLKALNMATENDVLDAYRYSTAKKGSVK